MRAIFPHTAYRTVALRGFLERAHEVAKDLPKSHHIHETLAELDERMGPTDSATTATPRAQD